MFRTNAAKLVSGSVGSQILTILTIPIITRLYGQENLGVYGVYLTLLGITSILATLRYEKALVISDSTEERNNITKGCLILSITSSALIPIFYTIYVLTCGAYNCASQGALNLEIILMLAAATFLMGLEILVKHNLIKTQRYRAIAQGLIVKTTVMLVIQLVLINYISTNGWWVLIFGHATSTLVYIVYMQRESDVKIFDRKLVKRGIFSHIKLLRKYNEFPKYMTTSAVCNTLTNSAIIILGVLELETKVIGVIFLAQKILSMPVKLISANLAHVNFQEFSEIKQSKLAIFELKKRVKLLTVISIFVATCVIITPADLYTFILGEEWSEISRYLKILIVLTSAQFIALPFINLFTVLNIQKIYLLWSISRVTSAFVLMMLSYHNYGLDYSLLTYCLSQVVMYLIAIYIIINKIELIQA